MEEGADGPPTDDGPSPPSVMRGLCPAHSSGMTQEVEEGADSLFLTRESVGGGGNSQVGYVFLIGRIASPSPSAHRKPVLIHRLQYHVTTSLAPDQSS